MRTVGEQPEGRRRRRLPWWVAATAWLVVAGLGLWLIARPLSSLSVLVVLLGVGMVVLGIAELAGARGRRRSSVAVTVALGAAWVLLGGVILVFRGFAASTLGIIVAVALLVSGVARIVDALVRREPGWVPGVVLGLAGAIFGVIAAAWPDLTLIVVAIAFGGWLVVVGLTRAWGAIAARFARSRAGARRGDAGPTDGNGRRRRTRLATVGAVVLLALALGAGWLSLRLNQGAASADAFYAAPVSAPGEPGVLIRAEGYPTGGNGIPATAEAWRILYSTTRDSGEPAVASALVVADADRPAGPRPMVAWAHGTTGFAQPCAPSLLPEPFTAGAMPAVDEVLDRGWVVVATDYVGLGTAGPHPYLIGQGEGRSVLDAMKAARQLRAVDLDDHAVIWGHSQGGHAALWAGGLQPEYAPDEPLDGVVAYAPASDLPGLVSALDEISIGPIFAAFTFASYSAIYDDVELRRVVTDAARGFIGPLSQRCLVDPATIASVLSSLAIADDVSVLRPGATDGAFGARLDENIPRLPIEAPLFVGQGAADPLVRPDAQARYVADRCADGQALEYREYAGADHLGVTTDPVAVADLLAFTEARFAGEPWTSGCDDLR